MQERVAQTRAELGAPEERLESPVAAAPEEGSRLTAGPARQTRQGAFVSGRLSRQGRLILVPLMLFAASLLMALAWLGHLRLKSLGFVPALFLCWLIVLPEYALNIAAIRLGVKILSGAQMASFRLCSGVLCVALVSWLVLGEPLGLRKLLGFALMALSMLLVCGGRKPPREEAP